MEETIRAIERASKMNLSKAELYGLVGRLLRVPGTTSLMNEALDEVERARADADRTATGDPFA